MTEVAPEVDRKQLASAIAGITSPIVFTSFVVGMGMAVRGYDHASQHISELARQSGPHAWVMRCGLVLVGLLDIALAPGLARGIEERGRFARLGPWLLRLLGVATMGVGAFPLDPAGHGGTRSWLATAHVVAAGTAFTLDVLTPFAFAPRLGADSRWRPMRAYSLASAALGLVLLVPVALGLFPEQKGVAQRAFLAVPFLWTGVMGAWLLRVTRRAARRGTGARAPRS